MFSKDEYIPVTIPHMSGIASILQTTTGYELLDSNGLITVKAIEAVTELFKFLDENGIVSVKISHDKRFLIKLTNGS